jgi:hypothetical protein
VLASTLRQARSGSLELSGECLCPGHLLGFEVGQAAASQVQPV